MEAPSKVYCLVYASTATELMSEQELYTILETARANNARVDVTGMLLYADGNFIQILEGDRERVEALYALIEKDPRHHGAVRMMRRYVHERSFADWRMGFKSLGMDVVEQRIPGFTAFLTSQHEAESLESHVSRGIWSLLQSFREVTRV